MTVKDPSANYSKEVIDHITRVYTDSPSSETVDALAKHHDKSRRSIIAKLCVLGVYQKALPEVKVKEPVILKAVYVEKVNKRLGTEIKSISNMTKDDLIQLVEILGAM